MAITKVPGVYFGAPKHRASPLSLGETGVAAFIGVAQRGPMNENVCIRSHSQFVSTFGTRIEGSYLYDTVYEFFANGGTTCYVIRVAHVLRTGKGEVARKARYEFLDADGYPLLDIQASSEGTWGNEVCFDVRRPEKARIDTVLSFDTERGVRHATVQSGRGLERGMIVRIFDGEKERFLTITSVRGNEITWKEDLDADFRASAPSYIESVEFNLTVTYKKTTERFQNLSLSKLASRNVERILASESDFIRVRVLNEYCTGYPEDATEVLLRGGKDGLTDITPDDVVGYNEGPDGRYGIACLEENTYVDIVCIPDLQYFADNCRAFEARREFVALHVALLNHCERMGDRVAILDAPAKMKPEEIIEYRRKLDSSYGALYYPWIRATVQDREAVIPPCGFVAGLCARCDREIGLFRAPANVDLVNAEDVTENLHEGYLGELNNKGINCFRMLSARGVRIWGARTLSSDVRWRYLPARRVFGAVKRAIYENTQWVVFEHNNESLRNMLKANLEEFLASLWAAGYFKGTQAGEAFDVECSEINNTREDIEAGAIRVDVGLALTTPLEFMYLSIEHQMENPGAPI